MTIIEKLDQVWEGYVGQSQAVDNAKNAVLAYTQSGCLPMQAVFGLAGVGKSEYLLRYAESWQAAGVAVLSHAPADYSVRGSGAYGTIKDLATQGQGPWILLIDEAHDCRRDRGLEGQRDVADMLHWWTDTLKIGVAQQWRKADLWYTPDPKVGGVVLATNKPEMLDGAFQSRLAGYTLRNYGKEELLCILAGVVRRLGLRWGSDKIADMVATCGRGSARPMVDLMIKGILPIMGADEAKGIAHSKTVTRDLATRGLKARDMLPYGVTLNEARIAVTLETIKASKQARLQARLIMETAAFREALTGLQGLDLIQPLGSSEWILSPRGHAWLALCRQDKFPLPTR